MGQSRKQDFDAQNKILRVRVSVIWPQNDSVWMTETQYGLSWIWQKVPLMLQSASLCALETTQEYESAHNSVPLQSKPASVDCHLRFRSKGKETFSDDCMNGKRLGNQWWQDARLAFVMRESISHLLTDGLKPSDLSQSSMSSRSWKVMRFLACILLHERYVEWIANAKEGKERRKIIVIQANGEKTGFFRLRKCQKRLWCPVFFPMLKIKILQFPANVSGIRKHAKTLTSHETGFS